LYISVPIHRKTGKNGREKAHQKPDCYPHKPRYNKNSHLREEMLYNEIKENYRETFSLSVILISVSLAETELSQKSQNTEPSDRSINNTIYFKGMDHF